MLLKIIFIGLSAFCHATYSMLDIETESPPSLKNIVRFSIALTMRCSVTNAHAKDYFQHLSEEKINKDPHFSFIQKPFNTDNYNLAKEEVCRLYINNAHVYQTIIRCFGTVTINSDYEKNQDLTKRNLLELAILAAIKEHNIDCTHGKFVKENGHFLSSEFKPKTPSCLGYLQSTLCKELSYSPCENTQRTEEECKLLKRYFPSLLLYPDRKPGKLLCDDLRDAYTVPDIFFYPINVCEIKDNQAKVVCNNFSITINEQIK